MLDCDPWVQEVLGVVASSLESFDAVCMATALHKMATVRSSTQQLAALGHSMQLDRLKRRIGAAPYLAPVEQLRRELWMIP